MEYKEAELEKKLVLKRYKDKPFKVTRVPEKLEVGKTLIRKKITSSGREITQEEPWTYPGCVPGRKHYPTNKSIPLEIYNGRNQESIPTGALVRIVHQEVLKVAHGKITNVEYIITEVNKK